ncbi:Isoprene synthase [Spatholobus suberectus]|nr:Isoprene synthase [Spatholobus suberectus]
MDIGLTSKMNFARDRFVESFLWSLGMVPEPQFGNCHKELTKVGNLITIVDDVYDVYGTLDELELFTDIVERWDVNAINTLPDYMILCFLALYNTVNEMAYDIFKERGIKCLPYLTKAWSDLCKSYLQEAKWFYSKVIPPFNEFLENGWISSGGGVLLIHSFFLVSQDQDITEQGLHSLTNYHDLLRSSMTILRLSNDLGTSKDEIERGETAISILSYLHETDNKVTLLSHQTRYLYIPINTTTTTLIRKNRSNPIDVNISVKKGKLSLTVGENTIEFDLFKANDLPIVENFVCRIDLLNQVVKQEAIKCLVKDPLELCLVVEQLAKHHVKDNPKETCTLKRDPYIPPHRHKLRNLGSSSKGGKKKNEELKSDLAWKLIKKGVTPSFLHLVVGDWSK